MSLVQNERLNKQMQRLSVSIHYMSLVQFGYADIVREQTEFQYIICRWFNLMGLILIWILLCFNTLYVVGSIMREYLNSNGVKTFQYIICRCFNKINYSDIQEFIKFQYIICRWFK